MPQTTVVPHIARCLRHIQKENCACIKCTICISVYSIVFCVFTKTQLFCNYLWTNSDFKCVTLNWFLMAVFHKRKHQLMSLVPRISSWRKFSCCIFTPTFQPGGPLCRLLLKCAACTRPLCVTQSSRDLAGRQLVTLWNKPVEPAVWQGEDWIGAASVLKAAANIGPVESEVHMSKGALPAQTLLISAAFLCPVTSPTTSTPLERLDLQSGPTPHWRYLSCHWEDYFVGNLGVNVLMDPGLIQWL